MVQGNQEAPSGSFGIPDGMKAQMERQRTNKLKEEASEAQAEEVSEETQEQETQDTEEGDKAARATDPVEILKEIGVTFDEDAFNNFLFKGYFESDVDVIPGYFKVHMKTLIEGEYEELDELLADEIKLIEMTRGGSDVRRSMLILGYSVSKIYKDGHAKPLCKPIFLNPKDPKSGLDTKATALATRKVLSKLSAHVTDKIIEKHGVLSMAIGMIVNKPEKYLKKS